MNRVATYLQGHLTGELTARADERQAVAVDGSILTQKPEMVIYPRTTNDIRKTVRFAWQLAEKGHALPVTARGLGSDSTGASLGRGVSLVLSRHMNQIFEYEPKQKLVRLQPGASARSVHQALRLHGTSIPALPSSGTIGGAVANNADGQLSGKYGTMNQWVDQLEIVLASGEVMQTGRISKRELSKRKGLQGREGDIYRGIDAILEDHAEFIAEMAKDEAYDHSGYAGISEVRGKGGSFDLTPLLVGSQGSLAIISEMIVRAEFVPREYAGAVALFDSGEAARDALDVLRALEPVYLEYFDGRFLHAAKEQGKQYEFLGEAAASAQAVVLYGFDDFNERSRRKRLKKAGKQLAKSDSATVVTSEDVDSEQLASLHDLADFTARPAAHADRAAPALIPGCYVPEERFEEFLADISLLEANLHIALPLHGSASRSIYAIRPTLSLQKVGDRQKSLKIIDQVAALVARHNGSLVARDGEGRLLSRFARAAWSDEYTEIVAKIKKVFDPHNILAPDTKADTELRALVTQLRSDNDIR